QGVMKVELLPVQAREGELAYLAQERCRCWEIAIRSRGLPVIPGERNLLGDVEPEDSQPLERRGKDLLRCFRIGEDIELGRRRPISGRVEGAAQDEHLPD